MNRKMLRNDQWARIDTCCQARPAIRAVRPGTTGCSLKRFSGFCAREALGETCHASWAIGTAHTFGLPVGVTPTFGRAWPTRWVVMPTWSNWSLIPPLSVPTSIPLVPKKCGQPGNRSIARRADDQAACCRGCTGQSAARHPLQISTVPRH